MNETIYIYPRTVYSRVCELAARVTASGEGLEFLLDYLALWSGPLGPVPSWLRQSVERFEARAPAPAIVLNAEWQLEHLHHRALAKDIAELCSDPALAEALAVWTPNQAVERHMFLRTTVPPNDPMAIIAIAHEHATLDAILGRFLLHVLRRQLPAGLHSRRFLELRALDAPQRARRTRRALDHARLQLGDCARTRAWKDLAVDVVDSYLSVLESFVADPLSEPSSRRRRAALRH